MDSASALAWPLADLGRGLEALARASGLPVHSRAPVPPPPPDIEANPDALDSWVAQACRRLNLEADAAALPYNAIEQTLREGGPALVMLDEPDGVSFLAVVTVGRRVAIVLDRAGRRRKLRVDELTASLRRDEEVSIGPSIQELLVRAGTRPSRRTGIARAILRDQFGPKPIAQAWFLRLGPNAPFWQHLRQALLMRHFLIVFIAIICQACVLVTAWWIVGRAALEGRFEPATLLVWTFLLLMLVPLSLVSGWSQGVFAIGAGGLLKLRLLSGALHMEPDEVRHQGVGQHVARVMESEAVETLTVMAAFSALAASVELLLGAAIFVVLSQTTHVVLLLAMVFITVALAWFAFKRRQQGTDARRQMTHDLVERMVGHRTRLAQESPAHWHDGEDEQLERYLALSARNDRADLALMAVPRTWLLVGLAALTPAFVAAQSSPGLLAANLGAILLVSGALGKVTSTLGLITTAAIGWKQVKPLLEAARRTEPAGCVDLPVPVSSATSARPLVIAKDLVFRFRDRADATLRACNFRISSGDRVHLSGPSGSGKSTLVSLLTGLRTPASGVLLLDGLDRTTLGAAAWRRRVVAAPQFHENHIFNESLAFNLLMGRRWPAPPEDLARAEEVCRRLGLGALLDRMPGGLFQLVGETGWQLSHGERSRVFMARALLQGADLVVLDESFAELDPESLRHCLSEVAELTGTLVVAAHA
jgi:ATP-binding cassette subfamily B protein